MKLPIITGVPLAILYSANAETRIPLPVLAILLFCFSLILFICLYKLLKS